MWMVAIEATIISTAMPQIVGQIGGLTLFSWAFSGFLLTQAAATVVFGKVADMFGRKPAMLFGIGFFLLGSTLCGFAWSMPNLDSPEAVTGAISSFVQKLVQPAPPSGPPERWADPRVRRRAVEKSAKGRERLEPSCAANVRFRAATLSPLL